MDIVWDGIRLVRSLSDDAAKVRNELADAARRFDWPVVLKLASEDVGLVNVCRPGGTSLYAPLHQAAYAGATVDVVARLIKLGAWRTLQNARGERPVDVADRQGHQNLIEPLTPVFKRNVPNGVLLKIQSFFHEIIRGRIDRVLPDHELRLPELEPLELDSPQMWFPVPGMYGGFSYRFETTGVDAQLISESWSRVSGGSGQRHLISSVGGKLIAEGFV